MDIIEKMLDESLWVYACALFMSYALSRCLAFEEKKLGRKISFSWLIIFFPLFFVSAFRYFVGTDYYQYSVHQIPLLRSKLEFFDYIQYDLLFVGIVKFFYLFTDSNVPIFFVLSLSVFFWGKWIIRESPIPSLSILLYFFSCIYSSSFNVMRQGLASSLFWLGFSYWMESKKKKAYVCYTGALFIHRTFILFLPLLLLFDKKIGMKKKCCICIGLLGFSSAFHVNNESLGILNILGMTRYFNSFLDTGDYNLRFLLPVALLFFLDWKYKLSSKSDKHRAYSNVLFVTLAVICFSSAIPLSSRVIYMFLPIIIVYVPLLRKSIKNGWIWSVIFTAYFAGIFVKQIIIDNVHQTLPYHFVWQSNEVDLSVFKASETRDLYQR